MPGDIKEPVGAAGILDFPPDPGARRRIRAVKQRRHIDHRKAGFSAWRLRAHRTASLNDAQAGVNWHAGHAAMRFGVKRGIGVIEGGKLEREWNT